jgi:SAM-dependent methyltransferase
MTLGRQDVFVSFRELEQQAALAGFALSPAVPEPAPKPEAAAAGYISDGCLLRSLGFSGVHTADVSDYEGAEWVLDLNAPELPAELTGAFDVVLDSGTLEHVFHVPHALRSVVRLLRPGGRVIHIAPSSNHMDHGFFMFSPTLFADYYRANGFTINRLQILRYTHPLLTSPWLLYDYPLDNPHIIEFGRLDRALYAIVCVATKGPTSTGDCVPQQSMYAAAHGAPADVSATPSGGLKQRLRRLPGAVAAYHVFRRLWRRCRPGLGLRVVARY